MTLTEVVNSISRPQNPPTSFRVAASDSDPSEESNVEAAESRARQITESGQGGSEFDNYLRGMIELKISQRAAEIARSPDAGSDFDNWLRAEHELQVAYRAEEIALANPDNTDYDNWVQAEEHVRVAKRAAAIAEAPGAGTDDENWMRAKAELAAEHDAIQARADEIAASAETAMKIRLRVEIQIRAEEIKAIGNGSDWENWLQAERELKPHQVRVTERAEMVAKSPEAALANWLQAEREFFDRQRKGKP